MSRIYNVPPSLLQKCHERELVIRATDLKELNEIWTRLDFNKVMGLQLIGLHHDLSKIPRIKRPLPIDLFLQDVSEFALLYRFSEYLRLHPIRLSLPCNSGFIKAARLALSLGIPVKLELTQPNDFTLEDLCELADFYLHRENVMAPIEPFQGLLLGFYHSHPLNLWVIQDEDPDAFVYLAEDGTEYQSHRLYKLSFSNIQLEQRLTAIIDDADSEECSSCGFFASCGGYFKIPESSYSCAGVKALFHQLFRAAEELKQDAAKFGGNQ